MLVSIILQYYITLLDEQSLIMVYNAGKELKDWSPDKVYCFQDHLLLLFFCIKQDRHTGAWVFAKSGNIVSKLITTC